MELYDSNICSGSLLVRETRIIANILLLKPTNEQWQEQIFVDNVLQKKSPITARKQSSLIRDRLELIKPDLWKIVVNGDITAATQAVLVSAIKESRLLGDFIRNVVRRKWETHSLVLDSRDWEEFLNAGEQISPNIAKWGDSTKLKSSQVVFRVLAEAGLIESTRRKHILSFTLVPILASHLKENNENYVLECLEWIK